MTSRARRAQPTGTAASPTTTCTWTAWRWPPAWCCTRISSAHWCPAGWLDTGLRRHHGATPRLANVVVLAPHPDWVATLPGGKLPDRQDFKAFRHDPAHRIAAWTQAVAAAQHLAD